MNKRNEQPMKTLQEAFAPGRVISIAVAGLGPRGCDHCRTLSSMPDVKIVAVCDHFGNRAEAAADKIEKNAGYRPKTYLDFDEMLRDGGFEAVAIATSWETHMRLSKKALLSGYPVAMEIGAGQSLLECQDLVRVSEETGLPVMPLENCCYNDMEMAVLHMVKKGIFGHVLHCEGSYEHDLRDEIGRGDIIHHYRQPHFLHRNAELYPTHEMGPIAKYLGINRGNRILTVSSIATKAMGQHEWFKRNRTDSPDLMQAGIRQGDVVTSMLTCANGETISLLHKCTLPCPYSRGGRIDGTKGCWLEDGRLIFVEGRTKNPTDSWMHPYESFDPYMSEYRHPLWAAYDAAKDNLTAGAHGGMDYLVDRAWINSLQKNIPPPLDVYDVVTWMSITVLSEQSISMGGMPQAMPDYTNGSWLTRGPAAGAFTLDVIPE